MNTAKQYIASNKQPNWVFAYAGGSVGRGDADVYSDLNLYIVVASVEPVSIRKNVLYEDNTIQLNIQSWEGSSMMRAKPWDNRFLSEARIVYDPHGVFKALKPAVLEYFNSNEGRNRMLKQAKEKVEHYLQCLDSCLHTDDLVGASIAVQTAWLTAAHSVAWMRHGSCSNGRLLPIIQEEEPAIYDAFRAICMDEKGSTIDGSLMSLARYRQYLRELKGSSYMLEPIVDMQIARKVERMVVHGREVHIHWLLRKQALMCYIATEGGCWRFDEHYHNAPLTAQHALDRLGIRAYSSDQLSDLLRQVEWLIDQAKRAAAPVVHEIS
ncbi:hypothetical protein HUB94_12720 [Paenibacillus cellulosilyticus]|nr:hypothetical protein [Paenibacillus cellulosilyticus]QKS45181.1 hypothetical protein HUB94_12720 [Paenibacillus cellulosilyticus]